MENRLLDEFKVFRVPVTFTQILQSQMRVPQAFIEAAVDDVPEHDAASPSLVKRAADSQ